MRIAHQKYSYSRKRCIQYSVLNHEIKGVQTPSLNKRNGCHSSSPTFIKSLPAIQTFCKNVPSLTASSKAPASNRSKQGFTIYTVRIIQPHQLHALLLLLPTWSRRSATVVVQHRIEGIPQHSKPPSTSPN